MKRTRPKAALPASGKTNEPLKKPAPRLARDTQQLITLASHCAKAGSRYEDVYWEREILSLATRLMANGKDATIEAALDSTLGTNDDAELDAHETLLSFCEAAAECAMVEADGSLTLLGRGSACINTAGEKVFPEEVEEVLKTHASVEDALVVGLPDEKWGQAVTAVVILSEGHDLDEPVLRAHVRRSLAGYKSPKRVLLADRPLRASNGKADYAAAKASAEAALAPAID